MDKELPWLADNAQLELKYKKGKTPLSHRNWPGEPVPVITESIIQTLGDELLQKAVKKKNIVWRYENFSLEPKGKYVIKICDGTACHVRKSVPILEEFRKVLGVSEEKPTTEDMLFTVETVSCLGACGLAPVCTVNDHVHPAMTPVKARELIQSLQEEAKGGAGDEN